jgi:putative flippase GtrA
MWYLAITRRFARYDSLIARQFVKFCLVGVLNTVLTLSGIFLLMRIFKVNYVISNMVGYVLGVVNSFLWNKRWTFRSKGPLGRESVAFGAVFALSYVIQLGGLVLLKEIVHVHVEIAQVLSLVLFSVINFLGNKFISFAQANRPVPRNNSEVV